MVFTGHAVLIRRSSGLSPGLDSCDSRGRQRIRGCNGCNRRSFGFGRRSVKTQNRVTMPPDRT